MSVCLASAGGYKLRAFTDAHALPSTTAVRVHHRPAPLFHSFVLASKLGPIDTKLFGVALIVHATVKKDCAVPALCDVTVDIAAPVAIVIMSRYPVSVMLEVRFRVCRCSECCVDLRQRVIEFDVIVSSSVCTRVPARIVAHVQHVVKSPSNYRVSS